MFRKVYFCFGTVRCRSHSAYSWYLYKTLLLLLSFFPLKRNRDENKKKKKTKNCFKINKYFLYILSNSCVNALKYAFLKTMLHVYLLYHSSNLIPKSIYQSFCFLELSPSFTKSTIHPIQLKP